VREREIEIKRHQQIKNAERAHTATLFTQRGIGVRHSLVNDGSRIQLPPASQPASLR